MLRLITWLSLMSPALVLIGGFSAFALPTADSTSGTRVTADMSTPGLIQVEGGTIGGRNLFHSFESFGIDATEAVYFLNPSNVDRVFGRVTGDDISQIDGVLGSRGSDADLFLMNPNGVVLGPTARLDLQGSLFITTADAIQFGDAGVFSAFDAESPTRLLTVAPSAFLFNQLQPGSIESTAQNLTLLADKGVTLLGGDILLQGSTINHSQGDVEIGGISEVGRVALEMDAERYRLSFGADTNRANVSLDALSSISSLGGGSTRIYARDLSLNGSGIFPFLILQTIPGDVEIPSSEMTSGANVLLDVSGKASISNESLLATGIFGGDERIEPGSSGNINITAASIDIANGSFVAAVGAGQSDAGNVNLTATEAITISGRSTSGNASAVGSPTGVLPNIPTTGSGGDVTLRAPNISMSDGAGIAAINNNTSGDAGNISAIATDSFVMDSGASLRTSTIGQGNAGAINVSAENLVSISGVNTNGNSTQVASSVDFVQNSTASRQGGEITISTGDAGTVELSERAFVLSNVEFGATGNGGNVRVNAGSLNVTSGAQLQALTRGTGDAGNVFIDVEEDILFDGTTADSVFSDATVEEFSSAVFTSVESTDPASVGNAGNIKIDTHNLRVVNGARLSSASAGQGNAGDIAVTARGAVQFSGVNLSETLRSGAYSTIEAGAVGDGGDLIISADTLEVLDGALVTASIAGTGNAGIVSIDVRDRTVVSGVTPSGNSSLVLSRIEANGAGQGGAVSILTNTLEISNTGAVSASTQGAGNAGDIVLRARESISIDSEILPTTAVANTTGVFTRNFNVGVTGTGEGGSISIFTPELTLRDGGVLDAQTANDKIGGNINIKVDRLSVLQGGHILVAGSGSGAAGTVTVNAAEAIQISGVDSDFEQRARSRAFGGDAYEAESDISAISLGSGSTGNIILNSPVLTLADSGEIIAESATADGGNIVLTLRELLLLRSRSQITATAGTAQGQGNGGNVTITVPFIVAIPEEDSDITADAFAGDGGRVDITARGLFGIESRPARSPLSDITASSEQGVRGEVALNSLDTSFIQSGLTELDNRPIDSEALVANGCVARSQDSEGSLVTTGSTLTESPTNATVAPYSVGTVQAVIETGDSAPLSSVLIIEPDAIYQLADGRQVISRACS